MNAVVIGVLDRPGSFPERLRPARQLRGPRPPADSESLRDGGRGRGTARWRGGRGAGAGSVPAQSQWGRGAMGTRVSRRGTIVGAVVALALVAATSFAGRAEAQTAGDGLIPEGDWTEAQVTYLVDLIHRTEATLPARFPTSATWRGIGGRLGARGRAQCR